VIATLLIAAAFSADCDRGWTRRAVMNAVQHAETAHLDLDVPGLHASADQMRDRLPCLAEPLTPADAARIHRVEALSRFEAGDREGAAMAFAAARSLEPDWTFPEDPVPEGHALQQIYKDVPIHGAAFSGVPDPDQGTLLLDGSERRGRPRDWPVLVQIVGSNGVLTSTYLWPDDPFPQVATGAKPLALFGAEGLFVPPSRQQKPSGAPARLEDDKTGVRYDAVSQLESHQDATAIIVWVLFTDPSEEVRFKAWRVLRARTRRGLGDMALQSEVVHWLAENGDGVIQAEAADLLHRLPAD
jgi:hypothetical protein